MSSYEFHHSDECVDYWVIRNPDVCCLKSSIKDINLNVEISFIFYNVIQICYINHTISYFQIFLPFLDGGVVFISLFCI